MAYYTDLRTTALKTMEQCDDAEDRITSDPKSYSSPAAYRRGAHCTLTKGAATKLAQVRRRYFALFDLLPEAEKELS